jgi:hypothetical protein
MGTKYIGQCVKLWLIKQVVKLEIKIGVWQQNKVGILRKIWIHV